MSTEPELEPEATAARPEAEPELQAEAVLDPASALPAKPVIGQSATSMSQVANAPAGPAAPPATKITEVTVTSVSPKEVEVRLADGRTGVIPSAEFSGSAVIGQVLPAAVLAREDPKNRPVLSQVWALKLQAWERLEAAKKSGTAVIATVTKKVKGGLVADVGMRAFVPTSLFSETPGVTPESLIGTEVAMMVVEIDRDADRVVLSIRDAERRQRRAAEREALQASNAITGCAAHTRTNPFGLGANPRALSTGKGAET